MFVTDADGTLMGQHREFEQYRAFRDRIAELRSAYGIIWVVCTGRSLGGYKHIFRPMRIFGISPDFVIINHAYIFECKKWGFVPHWTWNLRILWLEWRDTLVVRRALPKIRKAVLSQNPFARTMVLNRQRLSFRFDDEGAATYGAKVLRAEVEPYKHLQVFQSPLEITVRVIPFTKGLAVAELARHLGIANSKILVVGDGFNDISMMELEPPCLTACPANAAPEVVETVHRTHGHIASEPNLDGVLEVLTAYERGEINDRLPADWEPSEANASPTTRPPSRGIRGVLGTAMLIFMILYTTLLVVATFVRFPGSDLILKPYDRAVKSLFKGCGYVNGK